MFTTTDNNCGTDVGQDQIPDLQNLANRSLKNLVADSNGELLVFPPTLNGYGDRIDSEVIFSLEGNCLTTGNIMGFIGMNETKITIRSRFANNDEDYFLHYMLQKVFSINLFDLKHGITNDSVFDFLLYLFPYYLKRALRQGLYKEYHRAEYNDSNVRGAIDFNRHIRKNVPFAGSVAYKVREHSFDNKITQLVRHTIEFIRQHPFAAEVLNIDTDTQECVRSIMQSTPTYNRGSRVSVINKNIRPFSHPFYSDYRELKNICMQILRLEGLKYGKEKDKVYGILFDGAWLWEEYLNTFLKGCGFNHPRNNNSEGGIYLFAKPKVHIRYPDFWKKNFVLDAKYKRGEDRNDLNQIVAYMYMLKARRGGFVLPQESTGLQPPQKRIGELNGYGGEVLSWRLAIPQSVSSFSEFCYSIKVSEDELVKCLVNYMNVDAPQFQVFPQAYL